MKVRWYDIVIWILITTSILMSCGKEPAILFHLETTYKIKKGHHYSGIHVEQFPKNNHMRFTALFNETAIYQTTDPANQSDINKLYGFTDCTSPEHENSARFGWNWYQDKLNIYAYVYDDGVVKNQLITSVELNQHYDYEIILDDDKYTFKVNNQSVTMSRGCKNGIKYHQFPYFGGTEAAPHDIQIKVKLK